MATLIARSNLSEAWLEATSFLLKQEKHRSEHLVLTIENPVEETPGVRELVDQLFPCSGISSVVERVADTIFPKDFYDSDEDNATAMLFERRRLAREFEGQTVPNGNYFDRMCEYPQDGRPFNQIEFVLDRLRASKKSGTRNANRTEIGLSLAGEEIRIQAPGTDRDIMGFPCLSHVSITLASGRIHLAATYRAQRFVEKAYGNLLGLGRLANFIATESGFGVGEVMCIATGAVLGECDGGISVVRRIVQGGKEIINRNSEK